MSLPARLSHETATTGPGSMLRDTWTGRRRARRRSRRRDWMRSPGGRRAQGCGRRRRQGRHARARRLRPRRSRRRLHRAGSGFRDDRRERRRRRPLRRPPAARRARVHPRPDPRDRRRGGALHREQPHRHGVGGPKREQRQPAPELGARLRGQLRRRVRDRAPRVPLEAVHIRRRAGRRHRAHHRVDEDGSRLRAGDRARDSSATPLCAWPCG